MVDASPFPERGSPEAIVYTENGAFHSGKESRPDRVPVLYVPVSGNIDRSGLSDDVGYFQA
jgi:hypothetical protein